MGGGGRCGASAVAKMAFKRSDKTVRAARLIAVSIVLSLVMTCCGQEVTSFEPPFGAFPSVANSTILFLHVFKCGGTSLRQVFMSLAEANRWSGAVVPGCHTQQVTQFYDPPGGGICVTHENQLVDQARGKWLVAGTKVLAGHFLWDFRTYVTQPYLLITTLRNPLELFVSGLQFKHRNETQTLDLATSLVGDRMRDVLRMENPIQVSFIRGFLDNKGANSEAATNPSFVPEVGTVEDQYRSMTKTAIEHLGTFFVVGVVEQYEGFIHFLRRTMDPQLEHPGIWEEALVIRNNGSPVGSKEVLSNVDEDLVRRFNESALSHLWEVYEVALQLWDTRCREVLPVSDHESLCAVPGYA